MHIETQNKLRMEEIGLNTLILTKHAILYNGAWKSRETSEKALHKYNMQVEA